MKSIDFLELNKKNAIAEMKAARGQIDDNTKEKTAFNLLDESLPVFHNPLTFEDRVELYFYLQVLADYAKDFAKPNNEFQENTAKRIAEKQKEIEELLNKINKPVTPIKDFFYKEVLSSEDREKRNKSVEMYGSWFMPIQTFIGKVLYSIHDESAISAFSRLVNDYGLVIYGYGLKNIDMEKSISSKELLNKLELRKSECLIDADDYEYWKPLKEEKKYYVYIDDVARAYYLAGNNTFDWYNEWKDFNKKCEVTSHPIPEEIKADIEKSSAGSVQVSILPNNDINGGVMSDFDWYALTLKKDAWTMCDAAVLFETVNAEELYRTGIVNEDDDKDGRGFSFKHLFETSVAIKRLIPLATVGGYDHFKPLDIIEWAIAKEITMPPRLQDWYEKQNKPIEQSSAAIDIKKVTAKPSLEKETGKISDKCILSIGVEQLDFNNSQNNKSHSLSIHFNNVGLTGDILSKENLFNYLSENGFTTLRTHYFKRLKYYEQKVKTPIMLTVSMRMKGEFIEFEKN